MRTIPILLFWVFLFSYSITIAQTQLDTIAASQYYKKADSLLINKKFNQSIVLFEKALSIYEKKQDWEKVMDCYNKIASNLWRNVDYEKSIEKAEKALDISAKYMKNNNEQEAIAYDHIGKCYMQRGDYKKALVHYKKALQIRNKILPEKDAAKTNSYLNIGIVHYSKDEIDQAIVNFKKSLEIMIYNEGEYEIRNVALYNNLAVMCSKLGRFKEGIQYCDKALVILNKKEDKHYLSGVYHTISELHIALGKTNKAIEYAKKSCRIKEEIFSDHPELALGYERLGGFLSERQEYDEALQYLRKAENIYIKKLGKQNHSIAKVYSYIGNIYIELDKFSEALLYLELSLEIDRKIFGKNHTNLALIYEDIAIVHKERGNIDTSLDYFQKALECYKTTYGAKHRRVAMLYNDIGDLFFDTKRDYKSALRYYLKAQDANSGSIDRSIDPNILLDTSKGLIQTYNNIYVESRNPKDLDLALKNYEKAAALINQVRQTFTDYKDKIIFAKKVKEINKSGIKAQLLLSKQKGQQAIERAFYYSEKSKSNTLKEQLADSDAKSFIGMSGDIIKLEKKLRQNRSYCLSKITEEKSQQTIDTAKIVDYENRLFDINKRQDSLISILEKNYPKYHELKYQNDIVSVVKTQELLDDKTTMIEFFTSDSTTYAFTITKQTLTVKELLTPKLTEKIEKFRKSILDKDIRANKKHGSHLYETLIAPIESKLEGDELIIIPDGPLWHLNFELLLTKNDVSENPGELSYLLKDYAITYANSANLLFNSFKEVTSEDQREGCLAFSFSDSTNVVASKNMSLAALRDTGDDLPGTRKEIRAIADIIDGQYYFGTEANETNFKKNADRYKIVHLALHGEVDHDRPENSKLFFTKSKDTIEDNLLYAHELFALDIPSELTVLSACNTGTGKIAKGEGIMSLGNAFQYAGTKSLLLSNLEVPDDTAPELMQYFYTNLKSGMNKGKALQQAKLQYLKTADLYHKAPFYWGGFYLVGDSAPISFSTSNSWYWMLGLGALGIILLGWFLVYKRKRG